MQLYKDSLEGLSEQLLKHSTIIGFSRLDLTELSNEKVSIDAILAPVIDGTRCLEQAHRVPVSIADLALLAVRTQIKDGKLYSRHVKNQFCIRIDVPSSHGPDVIKFSEIPTLVTKCPHSFKNRFPDFLNSLFLSLSATRLDTYQKIKAYIPCSEILRFYYPHTALIEAAFSGGAANEALFNPSTATSKSDRAFVQLRRRIPDVCAPHVARIRFSNYAENKFNRIYTDSIHSTPLTSQADHFLHVCPPICGEIDWLIEGTELDAESILINGIYQCNAVFPFQELMFGRDNDGRSPDDRPKPKRYNPIPTKKPITDTDNGPRSQLALALNGTADAQIETLQIDYDLEEDAPIFGSLQNIDVKKIEKVAVKDPDTMNVRVYIGEEAVAAVATSGFLQEENKDKFAKAEISTGTMKKSDIGRETLVASLANAFDNFQLAIQSLNESYDVTWRKASSWRMPRKDSFYLNAFLPSEIGDVDFLWLDKKEFDSCDISEKFYHSRKFVVAEVSQGNHYLYFVDFEKKEVKSKKGTIPDNTSILFFYDPFGVKLSDQELKDTIFQYAQKRSTWPDRITRHRLTHQSDLKKFTEKMDRRALQAFRFFSSSSDEDEALPAKHQ